MKKDTTVELPITLNRYGYFVTHVYDVDAPQFLKSMSKVSEEHLKKAKKVQKEINSLCPVTMSDNYCNDPKIVDFTRFVGETAWNIFNEQGYAMDDKVTYFTELWAHEHHKTSNMEQHVHNGGAQMVGFYFLECPEECSKVLIYDPRPGKVQINPPQRNDNVLSDSSVIVNFTPKAGMLMFLPAWLPHSFTRNGSDKPMKFVHFNISVQNSAPAFFTSSSAEVV
jgi:uncharacterized protein (TIGR02466 family)